MSETESGAVLREPAVGPELVIDLTDAGRARAALDGARRDALEVSVDRLEVVPEPLAPPRRLPGTAMLVGSSGGHLAQLQTVAPLWDVDHRSYVTFDTEDAALAAGR